MKLFKVEKDYQVKEIAGQKFSSEHKEKDLEDLIWKYPDILGENYLIFGRQEKGKMGILDLLGIHRDGKIVIFELKRGVADIGAIHQAMDYRADVNEYTETKFQNLAKDYFKSTEKHINVLEKKFDEKFNLPLPDLSEAKKRIKLVVVAQNLTEQAKMRIDNHRNNDHIDISAKLFEWFTVTDSNEHFLLFYPYPPDWEKEREYPSEDELSDTPNSSGLPEQFRDLVNEKVLQQLQSMWMVKSRGRRNSRNINWEIFSKDNNQLQGYLRLRWRGSNNLQLFWWDKNDNKIEGNVLEKNWHPPTTISDVFIQKVVDETVKFAKSQNEKS